MKKIIKFISNYTYTKKPWPRPGQAKAKPCLMALAWPGVWESQSHLRPGQSRGFQAKPGWNNTSLWSLSQFWGLGCQNQLTCVSSLTKLCIWRHQVNICTLAVTQNLAYVHFPSLESWRTKLINLCWPRKSFIIIIRASWYLQRNFAIIHQPVIEQAGCQYSGPP